MSSGRARQEIIENLVAVVNRLEDRVEALDVRLRGLELVVVEREADAG